MSYGIYYVYITALIPSYEEMIIAGLVKKGYRVGPLADSNKVTVAAPNSVCAIIALRVDTNDDEGDTSVHSSFEMHEKVEAFLLELKIFYYSLIVTEMADCCWNISNIEIPKALLPPPVKKLNPNIN